MNPDKSQKMQNKYQMNIKKAKIFTLKITTCSLRFAFWIVNDLHINKPTKIANKKKGRMNNGKIADKV